MTGHAESSVGVYKAPGSGRHRQEHRNPKSRLRCEKLFGFSANGVSNTEAGHLFHTQAAN